MSAYYSNIAKYTSRNGEDKDFVFVMGSIREYLPAYKEELVFRGTAQSTIDTYLKTIELFLKDNGDIPVYRLNKQHIKNWVVQLRSRGSENYIIRCLWAVRSLMKYLYEEQRLDVWHFEDFKIEKKSVDDYIEYLENEEVDAVIKSIDISDIHGLRLRTFIETMLGTGMRPGETLKLRVSQVRRMNQVDVQLRDGRKNVLYTSDIIGKGSIKRTMYMTSRAMGWVERYIEVRSDDCDALFVTHCTPKPLSQRALQDSFRSHIKRIKFPRHIVLHDLRHTCATNMLVNGCAPDYIMEFLGHRKIDTTRKYYIAKRRKHVQSAVVKYLDFSVD